MKGDFHVRFRENLRVKLPWVTRRLALWVCTLFLFLQRFQTNCQKWFGTLFYWFETLFCRDRVSNGYFTTYSTVTLLAKFLG
jgi:hypothetical protein